MGRTQRARSLRKSKAEQPSPLIHHDLYKFLSKRGWTNSSRLTVSTFPLTGRGLRAKCDLAPHDLIIDLPHRCLISLLTLESDNEFVKLFENLDRAKSVVPFQSLLALFLQFHKMQGESSEWSAYIKTLPESFSTPFFCKKSELYCLTESILEKIVEQSETIKRSYKELTELLTPVRKENFDLDTFKWAYFVCNSRSVYVNGKSLEPLVECPKFKEIISDSPNMALAPLLDLLNHSDQAVTKSQLTHNDISIEINAAKILSGEFPLSYQLFTSTPVKKFNQIFINYGNYNNTKLLVEYGFTVAENQFDFLEFSLEDINSYIKSHLEMRTMVIPKHKYKFIKEHDLDRQMFIDPNDGLNHNFQAVLSILLVPQNLYNLTQVAFGDEIDFDIIRSHAIEILKRKKIDFEKLVEGLSKQTLSISAEACLEYFRQSIRLVEKVLNSVESL
jgi:SET domain